jgi:hypothetical protein
MTLDRGTCDERSFVVRTDVEDRRAGEQFIRFWIAKLEVSEANHARKGITSGLATRDHVQAATDFRGELFLMAFAVHEDCVRRAAARRQQSEQDKAQPAEKRPC